MNMNNPAPATISTAMPWETCVNHGTAVDDEQCAGGGHQPAAVQAKQADSGGPMMAHTATACAASTAASWVVVAAAAFSPAHQEPAARPVVLYQLAQPLSANASGMYE